MEQHQNCLIDDGNLLDDGRLDPVRRSLQETNPAANGYGPYPLENVSRLQNLIEAVSSSSSNPAVASQVSQDSGFLSTPSCDSSNHGGYFTPHRKTTLSSFGSITSDAWCESADDSTFQNDLVTAPQESQLIAGEMNRLCKGSNVKNTIGVLNTNGGMEGKDNSSHFSDASCHINIDSALGECLAKDESGDSKYSKYLPVGSDVRNFANTIAEEILKDALVQSVSMSWNIQCSGQCSELSCQEDRKQRKEICSANPADCSVKLVANCSRITCSSNLCWTPELPYSPSHSRPSRLSSVSCSHDSLVAGQLRDDSRFIKEAVSHEVLSSSAKRRRSQMFEPEIYSCPVDTLRPSHQRKIFQPKAIVQQPRTGYHFGRPVQSQVGFGGSKSSKGCRRKEGDGARSVRENKIEYHSRQDSTLPICHCNGDSTHKKSASSCNCSADQYKLCKTKPFFAINGTRWKKLDKEEKRRHRRSLSSNIRNAILALFTFRRTPKELGGCVNAQSDFIDASNLDSPGGIKWGKICPLPSAPPLRHCNEYSAFSNPASTTQSSSAEVETRLVGERDQHSPQHECRPKQSSLLFCLGHPRTSSFVDDHVGGRFHRRKSARSSSKQSASKRALPPLPRDVNINTSCDKKSKRDEEGCDFASIIDKVKDYGWYWGPISGESAEKVLSNEPDGSFIVRDSSDYHYIFSLTFRLNGVTRHVRIEHDQGNFSFGGFTRFKSQTIVDFIEKAVEHSRSGRYLFFLHRRPVLGPMRVQLLHPVSRFKHVQSLQHLCRFAIVNHVRRDLINSLPLPQRLKEYLSSPHYYSELVERCMSNDAEESRSIRQSSGCCLDQVTNGDDDQVGTLEASAISQRAPNPLLPNQFVHGSDSRSPFVGSVEYPLDRETPLLSPSAQETIASAPLDPPSLCGASNELTAAESWPHTCDCHAYSSQVFASTSESPSRTAAHFLLSGAQLRRSLSLGRLREKRLSSCTSNNLLPALALEMTTREKMSRLVKRKDSLHI